MNSSPKAMLLPNILVSISKFTFSKLLLTIFKNWYSNDLHRVFLYRKS